MGIRFSALITQRFTPLDATSSFYDIDRNTISFWYITPFEIASENCNMADSKGLINRNRNKKSVGDISFQVDTWQPVQYYKLKT